jgi:voltage-gated potassium channel Kch
VAVPPQARTDSWWLTLGNLVSWQFVQLSGMLVLLLFLVGWVIWLVEHKQQVAKGDSHTIRHISEGFWWAAATMTTVGYGDKTPLTRFGRLVGVVWMFMALMLVASFIASFASALTV